MLYNLLACFLFISVAILFAMQMSLNCVFQDHLFGMTNYSSAQII